MEPVHHHSPAPPMSQRDSYMRQHRVHELLDTLLMKVAVDMPASPSRAMSRELSNMNRETNSDSSSRVVELRKLVEAQRDMIHIRDAITQRSPQRDVHHNLSDEVDASTRIEQRAADEAEQKAAQAAQQRAADEAEQKAAQAAQQRAADEAEQKAAQAAQQRAANEAEQTVEQKHVNANESLGAKSSKVLTSPVEVLQESWIEAQLTDREYIVHLKKCVLSFHSKLIDTIGMSFFKVVNGAVDMPEELDDMVGFLEELGGSWYKKGISEVDVGTCANCIVMCVRNSVKESSPRYELEEEGMCGVEAVEVVWVSFMEFITKALGRGFISPEVSKSMERSSAGDLPLTELGRYDSLSSDIRHELLALWKNDVNRTAFASNFLTSLLNMSPQSFFSHLDDATLATVSHQLDEVVSTLLNAAIDKGRRLLRDPKLSSLCKIIKFEFAGYEAAFVNAIQLSLRRSRDHGYSSLESWRAFAIFTHALVSHIALKPQAVVQVQLFNFPPRGIKHVQESMVSQRELLRISWASIADKYKAGDAFWQAFVTQNSHLAAGPFAGAKAESLSTRILGVLDTFIGCLSLSDVSLIPPVKQLGERHAQDIVVQAADYELFKQGILTMVRRSSDTPPTPQTQAAWSSFISIISAIMIEEGERSKKPGYVSVAERARGDTLHDFDRHLSTVLAEGLHYYSGSTAAFLNICSVQKTNVQFLVEAVSDALHSLKMISDNDFKGGFLCALAGRSIRFLHHLFSNASSLTVGNAQNILLRTRLFGFENWTSVINECLKRYCSGQLNAELAVSIHMNWVLEQERGLCSVEDYMLPARVFSDMWERIQSRDLASPLKFMVSGKLSLLPNMAAWRTSPHFFNKLRIMNLLHTLSIMSKSRFVGTDYQLAAGTLGVWLQILGMADHAEQIVRIVFTSVCDVIKEENTNRRSMVIYGLGDAVKELVMCGTQVSGFTDGDRQCASASWGSILDFANQVSERSSVYDSMFQLIPSLKTSIFRRVSIPVLFESLKRMIGEVVDTNKPPMSEVALRRLGVQHAIAGVLEEYYPVFLTGFIAFIQDIGIKMGTPHAVPVASWLRILFTIANDMSKATVSVRKINASVQQEDLSSIVKIQALYRGKMARASRRRARLLKSNALRDTLDLDSDDDDDEAQSARSTTYDSDSEWESPQFKIRFKTRRILKMLWDSMGAEQLHIVSAVVINYGDSYPMKLTDVGGPNKPVKVLVRELGDCLSRLCERCIFESAETAVSNQISVQRSNLTIIFDLFKDPDFGRTFVETLLESSSCNDHPAIRLAWLDLYTVLRNQMHHILAPPQVWEE